MASFTQFAGFGFAVASIALLSACGGGDGIVASAPVPIPTPVPGSARVDIFSSPTSQEFASIASGNDLRIRYVAETNQYQVSVNGGEWDRLLDDPNQIPLEGYPNQSFVLASSRGPNSSYFMTRVSDKFPDADHRYQYSNLAAWGARDVGGGLVAFGFATPQGAIPTSGSGSYKGLVEGGSTVDSIDWDGRTTTDGWVDGTVSLSFDFARGTLAGELALVIDDKGKQVEISPFPFADTVFSPGSSNFSGRFATNTEGPNAFSGLFAGPNGEELIGRWTVPFLFNEVPESAVGVWIAKRGN